MNKEYIIQKKKYKNFNKLLMIKYMNKLKE